MPGNLPQTPLCFEGVHKARTPEQILSEGRSHKRPYTHHRLYNVCQPANVINVQWFAVGLQKSVVLEVGEFAQAVDDGDVLEVEVGELDALRAEVLEHLEELFHVFSQLVFRDCLCYDEVPEGGRVVLPDHDVGVGGCIDHPIIQPEDPGMPLAQPPIYPHLLHDPSHIHLLDDLQAHHHTYVPLDRNTDLVPIPLGHLPHNLEAIHDRPRHNHRLLHNGHHLLNDLVIEALGEGVDLVGGDTRGTTVDVFVEFAEGRVADVGLGCGVLFRGGGGGVAEGEVQGRARDAQGLQGKCGQQGFLGRGLGCGWLLRVLGFYFVRQEIKFRWVISTQPFFDLIDVQVQEADRTAQSFPPHRLWNTLVISLQLRLRVLRDELYPSFFSEERFHGRLVFRLHFQCRFRTWGLIYTQALREHGSKLYLNNVVWQTFHNYQPSQLTTLPDTPLNPSPLQVNHQSCKYLINSILMQVEDILQNLTNQVKSKLERLTLNENDIIRSLMGEVFSKKVPVEDKPKIQRIGSGPAKMEVVSEESDSIFGLAMKQANMRVPAETPDPERNMDLEELVDFFNATKPDSSKSSRSAVLATIRQRKQRIIDRKRAKQQEQELNGQFESNKQPTAVLGLKQLDLAPKKPHHQQTHLRAIRPQLCSIHDQTIKPPPAPLIDI